MHADVKSLSHEGLIVAIKSEITHMELTTITKPTGETAVYELFDMKPTTPPSVDAQRIDYLGRKLAMARKLGLGAQEQMIEYEIAKAKTPRIMPDVAPLTNDEYRIWRAFLPTTYCYSVFGGKLNDSSPRYRYDSIPLPVMQKWQACLDANLFHSYELMTPEIPRLDPVLIGVGHDDRRYMIARWAESDANFVTFAGVKRKLLAIEAGSWLLLDGIIAMLATTVVSTGFALVVDGVPFLRDLGQHLQTFAPFAVAGVVGAMGAQMLMQPIVRSIVRDTWRKMFNKQG